MDQTKIGGFISERRRANGWTQNQLAEMLGITNKAVSKWETGRSMPDLSLFPQLCNLLGITLNELFAGERIPEENLREKTDEVLLEVITNWLGHNQWDEAVPPAEENALEVCGVSKVYGSGDAPTQAVKNVSFQIPRGSFTGIMGASGCGKTTLLHLIATIDKPTGGTVRISGRDVTALSESEAARFRREHLGFVFQEYNLLDTLTIYENIALALTVKAAPKDTIRKTVLDVSEKLGISSVLDQFPYEVSGGQRQRCACARALAAGPDILLADEPTGALDSQAARQLLDTFSMLSREYGVTILMVTHDVMSASCCDRIFFMQDGEIRTSMSRNQENRQAFFAGILEKMAWMEEENRDVR
ncbi:MAG: ATP-binding cassette domain-containing protein [Ruminococcus sp.]|nr:ATP-binding cassette domain-containing protein [Ruminococcus sp.]